MFRLTLKLITGILGVFPAVVLATPVYVEYDVNVVDYCNCDGSGYEPGERIVGWLKIDTDRAPPDRFANEPSRRVAAQYWVNRGPDFISGTGNPGFRLGGTDGSDEVQVEDSTERSRYEAFYIWDYSANRTKPGATIVTLGISSEDRVDDFIHGKGLVQSFDSKDFKGKTSFFGRITTQLNGVRRNFDLLLNRLSVTPGHCRAPE